jgi:hypothetical protein
LRFWLPLVLLGAGSPWRLSWRDEFDSGSRPDPSRWAHEFGGHGFGNHELECYIDRNAQARDGKLILTAVARTLRDQDLLYPEVWTFRGSPSIAPGARTVARLVDSGRRHRYDGLARLRRDRYHGERRQRAWQDPRHPARPGLLRARGPTAIYTLGTGGFHLFNLAVGGDWSGAPDATTRFPQELQVDYVRVYTW